MFKITGIESIIGVYLIYILYMNDSILVDDNSVMLLS